MPQDFLTLARLDCEPFEIRRGDRVKVWMRGGEWSHMLVKGISPARQMVRVSPEGALRPEGFDVPAALCYPPDPIEPPKVTPTKGTRLSRTIARMNARHAPPGGWGEADAIKGGL